MHSSVSTWGRMRLALFVLMLALGFAANNAHAQARVNNYIVSSTSNYFNWDYGTYIGYGDDVTYNISMPFAFNYDNQQFASGSVLQISTNGWVRFGGGGTTTQRAILGSSAAPNTICVFAQDIYVGSAIYYTTTGSSGSRVLTVGWYYFYYWNNSTYWNYMCVKLYEADNGIEMQYYGNNWYMGPYNYGVGLNGGTTGGFVSYTYQNNNYTPATSIKFRPPKSDKPNISVSVASLNYGVMDLGTSQTLCLNVTNNGTAGEAGAPANPLTVNPSIIGFPAEFKITSPPVPPLNIGQTAQICVEFTPGQPSVRNSTLNIANNSEGGAKTVALTGTGRAALLRADQTYLFRKTRTKLSSSLEQSFWIYNIGSAPLSVTATSITGDYPEQYSIVGAPEGPIKGGDSGRFVVRFSPVYEGLKTAVLNLTTNAYGKNTHSVNLFGTGIIPRMTVTPGSIGTDSVSMGDTAWYTIRIDNIGSDTLAIRQNYFTSADPDFFYSGIVGSDSLIMPERFKEVVVGFTPKKQGIRQARLRFTTNLPLTYDAQPRDTSEFYVDIRAVGVPFGMLAVAGSDMTDSVIIGSEHCNPVTLTNSGNAPLTINSATITGTDASDFSISGGSFPMTIAAGQTVTVQVCATPSARGPRSASVDIVATSGDRTNTTTWPLSVIGLAQCAEADMMTAFTGEITRVGTMTTQPITITNCGDVPAIYTAAVTGAAYALQGGATSAEVAPGATTTFMVAFNPTMMAMQPGTLTVTSPGVSNIVVDLAGVGGNSTLAATGTNAPSTAVGQSKTFDVTVTNTGNMDWTVGTAAVNPNTEFVLTQAPTTVAANGGTGTFSFTFTPTTAGNRQATVTFTGGDRNDYSFAINGVSASVRQYAANGYELGQTYPNPVLASGKLSFTMAAAGHVTINVIDLTGNTVATIADGFYGQGANEVSFDVSNLASGSYIYEFVANGTRLQRSMILSK
jgi:hypothetical protein